MIDPVSAALAALAYRSPAAFGSVFVAGVLTSVGPCVAPRYVAIAALAGGRARPAGAIAAFVFGLVSAFVALGFVAGLIGTLWALSSLLYTALALGLMCGGGIALVRATAAERSPQACAGCTPATGRPRSIGAIVLLGAGSALVVSPCCTPVIAAVAATSAAFAQPLVGALLLLCFALGHAVPLLFAGGIGAAGVRYVPRGVCAQAASIVGAVLMLALGLYYGALA